jgi:hypothetical protein
MPQLALYDYTLERLQAIDAETFKSEFLDYIVANEHDIAWEGFTQRDLYGFGAILRDFCLAHESGGLDDGKVSCRICSVRVKPRGLSMHMLRKHAAANGYA